MESERLGLSDDRYGSSRGEHTHAGNFGDASTCVIVAAPVENALFDPCNLLVERAQSRELVLQAVHQHGWYLVGQ